MTDPVQTVAVPGLRVQRWIDNFGTRHGETELALTDGRLHGTAADGSWFSAALPFGRGYAGTPAVASFLAATDPPLDWGMLLVRKGGFAVARLSGDEITEHKIGQRHVQSRSKAGGWSQQRFARRRDNQARQAYEAAADHAARILTGLEGPLIVGGDHGALSEVLADRRLSGLDTVPLTGAIPDPRRAVLDDCLARAQAIQIDVRNA